jgi:alpha-ketoglutarate-dependent taurine dioxygenase
MALDSKVFGLTADEGMWGPHFSYTMAIEKDNRELVQTPEIESWFSSMLTDRYLYGHQWKQKDLALMDNWVSLHYIGSQNYEQERILWRKTLLQPWHTG